MYKALFAAAAAFALVLAFSTDASANPRVKFSSDSSASVDDNNVLSGNANAGSITTRDVNFESFNSDVEVITNKELSVAVTQITIALTGGTGGPGNTGTVSSTLTFACEGEAECTGTIDNHPTGGPGGSASLTTGPINCDGCFTGTIGLYNINNNTGIGNAMVAETALSVNAGTAGF